MAQLTWLVTGCSSGLGEQFVRSIMARGDKVIATCRGEVSRMDALKQSGAITYSLDVTSLQSQIDLTVEEIVEEHGQIDVLVNNAGYVQAGLAEESRVEDYAAQFDVNFFGVVKMTNAILPHFRIRRSGTILIIGSTGGIAGQPGAGPYCSTKFALEGWFDCLNLEVAHFNIRPILFELGFFRTKIFNAKNLKFAGTRIIDYDAVRTTVEQFIQETDGNQPGDPERAVEVILDIVRGEGVGKGRTLPHRLPLGADVLETMRARCTTNLNTCDEWEDVIVSTSL